MCMRFGLVLLRIQVLLCANSEDLKIRMQNLAQRYWRLTSHFARFNDLKPSQTPLLVVELVMTLHRSFKELKDPHLTPKTLSFYSCY